MISFTNQFARLIPFTKKVNVYVYHSDAPTKMSGFAFAAITLLSGLSVENIPLSKQQLRDALADCLLERADGFCTCASGCGLAIGPIHTWDVSAVADFSSLFDLDRPHELFNAPLRAEGVGWDTSAGQRFEFMFRGASSFDQPLGHFKTGQAYNMTGMFANA